MSGAPTILVNKDQLEKKDPLEFVSFLSFFEWLGTQKHVSGALRVSVLHRH